MVGGFRTSCKNNSMTFGFEVTSRLDNACGRTGLIHTPHGAIQTPAFVVVGTKATVKALLPESVVQLGAQAVLANAYHLFLQPGPELIDEAGGLGQFMNWTGPTFTDSGGFQVLSLGAGFKKTLAMDVSQLTEADVIAADADRKAMVDDDGVTFRSPLNGDLHRFTPEVSMGIQHHLGADIMFSFDELTTLMNTRAYQEEALERTRRWAERCLAEHRRLTEVRSGKPYQALFGVIQGAQYEDLRRRACRDLAGMEIDGHCFDGFGIGGAIEKANLGRIVTWCAEELPEDCPRHLLGISEPDDLFAACRAGPIPSIVLAPPGWPVTLPSTPSTGVTTLIPRGSGETSARWRTTATATHAPTIPAPISTTCSRLRSFSRTLWRRSTTSVGR